jgi:hypothetical protein
LIASNKNEHKSNKNLKAMISTISAHFPKKVVHIMVIAKMRPTPPLEMGSEPYQCTKGAFEHLRKPQPKSLSKICRRAKSKETS